MTKDKVAYEQPHGWMQQLVSETDGKKTIRYTFTKTRIGKNDIPIYFEEALEQPAPKNCTPLDEYIAEMEKDPEIKQLLDIAREDVKKWSTQPAQEPECSNHPDAPHGFCRNASHSADRYVCECEGWEAEQTAQEPVGDAHYYYSTIERCLDDLPDEYLKLHRNFLKDVAQTIRNTHPATSWQGLSDDEVEKIDDETILATEFARAIEQALRNKNT